MEKMQVLPVIRIEIIPTSWTADAETEELRQT